jgi:DNA-binding PadR family transcriptional regulator
MSLLLDGLQFEILECRTNGEAMKLKGSYLGEYEEVVLLAVLQLGKDAYGRSIRELLDEVGERFTSIGALYATLDRLERKGFISSRQGEATPERGGRAKRYFKVEGTGVLALREGRRIRQKLARGIRPGLLGKVL